MTPGVSAMGRLSGDGRAVDVYGFFMSGHGILDSRDEVNRQHHVYCEVNPRTASNCPGILARVNCKHVQ